VTAATSPSVPLQARSAPETAKAGAVKAAPRATSAGPPALRFADVAKRFKDGTVALTGVDLTIHRGEFVSIVGPSGCGKSTLLRIASGLDAVSEGAADVSSRSVGYVFQDATLLAWRSVKDNVGLFAELEKVDKATRTRRVAEAIELVGLTGFEKHLPHELSGGMRMRTSLARSCSTRTCSCLTSRLAPWTRSPGSGSTRSCSGCSPCPASPGCS
jgi:NitT/TauT family transport system ATP-binding protein